MVLVGKKNDRFPVLASLVICALALTLSDQPGLAQTYDVAADFSATSNPSGAWSFGWSSQLTSTLDLYSFHIHGRDIDNWSDSATLAVPAVACNLTSYEVTHNPETITWLPGQFSLHPGPGGEYSHARWTAPAPRTYRISAEFASIDHDGATTDVHVFHNDTSLFLGAVAGPGDTESFSTTIPVDAGDIIDFAVGFGTGGYWNDTTALAATISTVVSGVNDGTAAPNLTCLTGVSPNPFNPRTTISFSLPHGGHTRLTIHDLAGRRITVLADEAYTAGTTHTVTWNGCDSAGRAMPSGSYLVRLESAHGIEARKMSLIR